LDRIDRAAAAHIPQVNERAVLQKLNLTHGLPLEKLYPAGKVLIASMVAKGGTSSPMGGPTAGLRPATKALKAIIPVKR
jgi:hypothetical protein